MLAQTTTGTEANTYQLAFVNIAIEVLNIVLSTLVFVMEQVLTGFFSFILPA
jgi:hypothetical protein